jgi:hypothetical protein
VRRLGEALIDGKREPPSEAEAIRAEVAQQELRIEALRLAADRARGQIPKLVDANRAGWRRQAMRELIREKQRYEAAINELQAAREALIDVATLTSWLDSGDVGEATTTLPFSRHSRSCGWIAGSWRRIPIPAVVARSPSRTPTSGECETARRRRASGQGGEHGTQAQPRT